MEAVDLFSRGRVGAIDVSNRIVMAPLTRSRAGRDGVHTPSGTAFVCIGIPGSSYYDPDTNEIVDTGNSDVDCFDDGSDTPPSSSFPGGVPAGSPGTTPINVVANKSPQKQYCGVSGVGIYGGASGDLGAISDGGEYTNGLGAGGQASLSEVRLGNGQGVVFATTGGFYDAGLTTRASAGAHYGTVFGASLASVGDWFSQMPRR